MSRLALWFGIAFMIATGVFYVVAELSGQGGWARDVCLQVPPFCSDPNRLAYPSGIMLFVYLILRWFDM